MNKSKPKKSFTSGMPLWQIEQLSRRSAEKIVEGTDNLKSWGKSGWFKFKSTGKWVHYRSAIELRTYRLLDSSGLLQEVGTELLIIPYNFKGANLNYVPDIILKTKGGKTWIIEVKPHSQLEEEKNVAKWDAARLWCFSKGARFKVITEKNAESVVEIIKEKDAEQNGKTS